MKQKRRAVLHGATLLLLGALLLPAFAGALAEGEDAVTIPIMKETPVYGADGAQIGSLLPNHPEGALLKLLEAEQSIEVQVAYSPALANKTAQTQALAGKAIVQLERTQVSMEEMALPAECWVEGGLVITALTARHALNADKIADLEREIDARKSEQAATSGNVETPDDANAVGGIFSAQQMKIWVPIASLSLGFIGALLLGWIAFSLMGAAFQAQRQANQLVKLNDKISDGILGKNPLLVQQTAWPKQGYVEIVSRALDHLAKNAPLSGAAVREQQPPEPPPPPIPEGEEPELLALANSLVGTSSGPEWHNKIKAAGYHAVLLQANPNERGTYVADEGGYSVIACLLRGAEPELGYVVPSYQDPNASEPRWSEFFTLKEDISVRNYQIDALPVMFVDREVFFTHKSYGKLTRRPQY
jgi:hypothetical protein